MAKRQPEKDQIRNRFSSASRIDEVQLELGQVKSDEHGDVHFIRQDACDIAWSNLVVKGKGFSKEIIKNINGYVPRGSLMAIMGSSGAGKSTLMNVLAGRNLGNLTVEGQVSVNGHLVEDNMPEISAYVQQDDIFIGSMTVREQLVFHAALRMSHKTKSEQIERVEHVIEQMGLTKCKDTVIGIPGMSKTISGGEMKRLSFATEILTDPPIIFCDEPTSGLDSYLAETVIRTLKTLSQSGTTILCTIHQPSSQVFDLFSHLLLLAQGKVAFLGPTAKTPKFFEKMGFPIPMNFNPCDHYINHIALIPGREEESYKKMDAICQRYSITKTAKKNLKMVDALSGRFASSENIPTDTKRASLFVQMRWLLWRAMISHYRDTTFAAMKVFQNLGTAIFIGLLFLRIPWDSSYDRNSAQTVTSALFVMVTSYSMCYLFLVLMAFPLQVPVIRREHYGGHYTIFAAFFAEVLAGLPFFIVMPLLYTIIIYFMCGFAADVNTFFWCYLINVFVATACTGYGYFISALARNVKEANTIAPSLLIPLFLLSGFFIPAKQVPIYFIPFQYISWFYYGVENMVTNQWVDSSICMSLNISQLDIPIPDDCFDFSGSLDGVTFPTVPPEYVTGIPIPGDFPFPTGVPEIPSPEDLYDQFVEGLINSNSTCINRGERCPDSRPVEFDGNLVIEALNYEPENFSRNNWLLVLLSVVFRVLAYGVLAYRFRKTNR